MRVLLMLAFVLVAATALAFGHDGVTAGVTVVTAGFTTTEPTTLLLSGSVMLAVAGVVRRFSL